MTSEPRFTVDINDNEKVAVFDDEFHWDALLKVHGDFADLGEKTRYAQAICDVLNEAGERIPRE